MDEPHLTLPSLLARRVQDSGEATAYTYAEFAGVSRTVRWRELGERVQSFALGLTSLGMARSSRVCILGGPGPEWAIADLGTIVAGGVVAGLDPVMDGERLGATLRRLGCELCVCGTRESAERLTELAGSSSLLKRVVGWGRASSVPGVLPFGQVCLMGDDLGDRDSKLPAQLFAAPRPEDPAMILDTGDSGNEPRAVVLSHSNCCFSAVSLARALDAAESDQAVLHLPMYDPIERLFGTVLRIQTGMSTHIVTDEPLIDAMIAAKPTLHIGTPTALEVLRTEWTRRIVEQHPLKRHAFPRAQRVGSEIVHRRAHQQRLGPLLRAKGLVFDRLVLASARDCVGGRLRVVFATPGPAPNDLLEFYEALGIRTLEGWGTDESSGLCSLNPSEAPRRGSVGRAVSGVDLVVSTNKSLRTRGPHVCLGHLGLGGETVSASDPDGWLTVHSGARVDAQGYTWLLDNRGLC